MSVSIKTIKISTMVLKKQFILFIFCAI